MQGKAMNIHKQRLNLLREMMEKIGVDAYIIPMSDPHLSEYIPSFWKSIEWLCGFSGSAGTLLITQDEASLWTDGRYWIQAEKQLQGSGFSLQKASKTHTYTPYLLSKLKANQCVGIDGRVFSFQAKNELEEKLRVHSITLNSHCDLISALWENRPTLTREKIYEHPLKFAIVSVDEKLKAIRERMKELKASAHLVASLDDIAWITNLRGSDIECNPVFMSYLYIDIQKSLLFIQKGAITPKLIEKLEEENILVRDYEEIESFLSTLKQESILLDPQSTPSSLVECLKCEIIKEHSPSLFLKSVKNKKQTHHIKEAMIYDGVALCHLQSWLEDAIKNGESISELEVERQLHKFRSASPYFISDSFHAIVGFNANGAQCHYRATKEDFSQIEGNGFLLLDSGGNYLNGTTDITRVFPVGQISKDQKRDYTLVLKAHIAMSSTIFPEGIAMPLLDSITRAPLWKHHLDYAHGTGHGVGYFLNVHEGPQVLSYFAPALEKTKAREGMILSIEPGVYREGKWGVRLENLVITTLDGEESKEFGKFLKFETLSLYPFERECLELELLSEDEMRWINSYHKEVYEKLSKYLDKPMKTWLGKKTQKI